MENDLIEAVSKIADTDFDPTATFGANSIAKRPSGSLTTGFYRPGERSENGAPFEVTPTTCPRFSGPSSGRTPSNDEKRYAWQLQEEYLAGRLGKNDEENSRNWNTAKWIDRLIRTATMPATAVKGSNLCTDNFFEVMPNDRWRGTGDNADPAENAGFEFEAINIDERDRERLALKLSDYDLVRLWDYFKECDESAKIDIDNLAGKADPLSECIDLPDPIERQTAIKVVRILMMGMRSLWHPVKRAITDHATMKSLGITQNVADGVAATVGRTRVIEGLRLAESIRKGLRRQERDFSMWLSQIRARQTMVHTPGLAAARRQASVDEIIREVIAVLPMPVRAPTGHYWNLAAGPVIKLPDNDDCRAEAIAA
jgi:hypothetical protein